MAKDEMARELKRTVWAYLLENGNETSGEWSYYGGHWQGAAIDDYYEQVNRRLNGLPTRMGEILAQIKEHGVDWDKTDMPRSSTQSEFVDTEAPSSRSEALLGIITLKNGASFKLGCGNAELRFSTYVNQFFELATDEARINDIFGE